MMDNWEIEVNAELVSDEAPCPHCRNTYLEPEKNWKTKVAPRSPRHKWECPRLLIVFDNHESVSTCLDCVLENVK